MTCGPRQLLLFPHSLISRATRYIARPCTKRKQENSSSSSPSLSAPEASEVVVVVSSPSALPRSSGRSVSAMPSAPAAIMPESPSPSPARTFVVRPRSPLANGSAAGDFELRHWRTPSSKKRSAPAQPPPPVIEIPHNGGAGSDDDSSTGSGSAYTSLRDILSSPEYAAGSSPAAGGVGGGGGGGSCGDIHMIRHPLVKHAAYAYLQMTPSAREDPAARRARRWRRGPLCRLLRDCLSFVGALFGA